MIKSLKKIQTRVLQYIFRIVHFFFLKKLINYLHNSALSCNLSSNEVGAVHTLQQRNDKNKSLERAAVFNEPYQRMSILLFSINKILEYY